jgi:segregation and condensation protein A
LSIHVQLERYEGPLGLLLHLIREQEMDIFNINIHQITRQYLEYIKAMRRLDLEVAGEFVAMAATLLHIKSKMLLPQYNEDGEEIPAEDPRKELVQKLLEYKKIKELSVELYRLPLLGRDVFVRGEREEVVPEDEGELVLEENPLFSLISAYRTAVKNMKKAVHKVASELQSIASRILEMKELLIVGQRVIFRDLITARENVSAQVLVTFLSLLELAKIGMVSVFQTEPFADIYVETKTLIDRDVVSRVENYDAVNADANAARMINEAQLPLAEPVDVLEGEEEPQAEPIFAEAASDADIEEEERRLFAHEHVGEAVAEAAVEAEVAATPLELAGHEEAPVVEVAAPASEPVLVDALPSEEPVDQKLNSALSAAFSAFDAFESIPEPDKKPPEVES